MKVREDLAGLYSQITTSSAINPALKLCAISPFSFLFAILATDTLRQLLFWIGAVPIIVVMGQILWFTISDPDRLQNELHVERKMMIQRFGWKEDGENKEVEFQPDLSRINNPMLRDGGEA